MLSSRSWKCKDRMCNKQVTGEHIQYLLDRELGPNCRGEPTKEPEPRESERTEKLEISMGETELRRSTSSESLVISQSEWSTIAQAIGVLAANHNKLK